MKIQPSTIALSLFITVIVVVIFFYLHLESDKEEKKIFPVEYNQLTNQYRVEIPVVIYKKEITVFSTGYVYFDSIDSLRSYRKTMLNKIMGNNLNYTEEAINEVENNWKEIEVK